MILATVLGVIGASSAGSASEERAVPPTLGVAEARAAADRALHWLVENQNEDGSWSTSVLEGVLEYGFSIESFYAWKVAATGLACMAVARAPETSERRAALERGVDWLCTTRPPKRGSDWDIDYVWGGLYGFVACVTLADDPRFATTEWKPRIEEAGKRYYAILDATQVPTGGWGYYDDPIYSQRPKWATSFSTATVLPALKRAEELGWIEDEGVRARATRYVARCALPNGAFAYDLRPVPWVGGESINGIKGSLARIQVCNWSLSSVGEKKITTERIRAGIESFFRDHRFLDVAWMRPIPHEAYYYNSGYFYLFGHYYAALAIELLPPEEREAAHARLRPHLVKVLRENGSTSDFLISDYMVVAGTAYLALALELGIPAASGE